MYNFLFKYNAVGTYSFLKRNKTSVGLHKPKYTGFTDRHYFNLYLTLLDKYHNPYQTTKFN